MTDATNAQAVTEESDPTHKEDGGWNEKTPFPFIQGTDCCGRVVALGDDVEAGLMGKRALVRACMRGSEGFSSMENIWMASDFDGAFAQFVKVPASEVFPVDCDWSDVELGSIPCAYGTAESMVHRAGVKEGTTSLFPGHPVGSVQRSCSCPNAEAQRSLLSAVHLKQDQLRTLGADQVFSGRHGDPEWTSMMAKIKDSADVVIDNVGGEGFPDMVDALKRGGRYATSGAISGPIVNLDMRTMYLRDLTLIGCTAWDEPVFPNLVAYIERGEIKPLIAQTFKLQDIVDAQKAFLEKTHVGKFVLVPDAP